MFNFFKKPLQKKSVSVALPEIMYSADRKTEAFAREGYTYNAIVFRCINEIARAVGDLDIDVYRNEQLVDNYEQNELYLRFSNPSLIQTKDDFLKSLIVNYLISGSAYIEDTGKELFILPSHQVSIESNAQNQYFAKSYTWISGSLQKVFRVDPLSGSIESSNSRLLHIKEYNPLDPIRGLSPLEACAYSIDQHNLGMIWNNSLLKNGARLSGLLETENSLTDEQFIQLKKQLESWKGSGNAGAIPILEGGLKYNPIALSPVDMDFKSTIENAARMIASVLGVPFALVVPEAATYSNMETAREMLYENTVIPLADRVLKQLSLFLNKQGYILKTNTDSVSALEGRRELLYNRMSNVVKAGILTPDEARQELGYDELGGIASELVLSGGSNLDPSIVDTINTDGQN